MAAGSAEASGSPNRDQSPLAEWLHSLGMWGLTSSSDFGRHDIRIEARDRERRGPQAEQLIPPGAGGFWDSPALSGVRPFPYPPGPEHGKAPVSSTGR